MTENEEIFIEIVRLPASEWAAYKALRLAALQDAPYAFGASYLENMARPDSYWQNRLAEAGVDRPGRLLFARCEARLAGMIGAYPDADDPGAAWVISVYVDPQFRGRGIGKRLMNAILDELKAAGFSKAVLGVNAEFPAAVSLYRRFGFVVTGQKVERMGDGEQYVGYLMEKSLEEPSPGGQ